MAGKTPKTSGRKKKRVKKSAAAPGGDGSARAANAGRSSKAVERIRFSAALRRPAGAKNATWMFLNLPKEASARLPSRGMVAVQGTIEGAPFRATLEPDGRGGHWLKVARKLQAAAGAEAGECVAVDIAPMADAPEPKVPADLRTALAAATAAVRSAWLDITPAARRDFVQWIDSAKQAETRARRIDTACDMLAKGKRRPCCFDRSGMYGKRASCPAPEATEG